MTMLRAFLLVAWVIAAVTMVWGVTAMGMSAAGDVFIGDFAHPWRAQFNADFLAHLILMAAWIFYREPSPVGRYVCAPAAIFLGGAFSFLYIVVAATRAGGEPRKLLLGRHA
jgi:hypothetical protein